jgi:glutaconate CoA-transferase subunit A
MTAAPPTDLDGLVARIPDGATLALAADYYSGCAMAAVRRLIARGVRDLHLIGIPTLGFQADMLIGAGCVRTVECAAVTIGEHGPAPRFVAAVKAGTLRVIDGTCPAIHAGLQAAEKGVPFMPLRGVIGSDLVAQRDDWTVVDNAFGDNDPILLVKAIRPDVALFHAALADRRGNVWIGVRRELMTAAHAARTTLVTVEEIVADDLLADDRWAAGTIPALYISAVAEVRNGAWPLGLRGRYGADAAHLKTYVEMAQSEEGFQRYLQQFIGSGRRPAHSAGGTGGGS